MAEAVTIRITDLMDTVTINVTTLGDSWEAQFYILKSGAIWYRREINNAGGYFVLSYSSDSGGTWIDLMTLALTEDSIVMDLDHDYRHRIVGTSYHVDRTITATGYAGVEDLDWENIYHT